MPPRRVHQEEEDDDDEEELEVPELNDEFMKWVVGRMLHGTAFDKVMWIGDKLAPRFTVAFVLFLAIVSWFHESHPTSIGGLVIGWFFLRGLNQLRSAESVGPWRTVGRKVGRVAVFGAIYLVLGFIWSFIKLFLFVWRGHLGKVEHNMLMQCVKEGGDECFWSLLLHLKWTIFGWVTYWPVNIVFTALKDPLNIVFDFGFNMCRMLYVRILRQAGVWLVADRAAHF